MPFYTASSIESLLVFLVIILLSGISNWLKKKQEQRGGPLGPPPTGRPPVPGAPRVPQPESPIDSWEEELRRLFGEEPPVPPPVVQPVPPPPPVTARQAPSPAPAVAPARPAPPPVVVEEEVQPLPVITSSPVRFPQTDKPLDQAPAPTFGLAKLVQAAKAHDRAQHLDSDAYARATNLDGQAAYRLKTAVDRTRYPAADTPPSRRRGPAPETASTLAQLRHPRSARQAIIASVIMAPPKALE